MSETEMSNIRNELMSLVDDDGLLKPPVVHDWAEKHPKSDLYGRLEWDDSVAGYQYRLTQIRQIITVHVTTVDHKPEMISLSVDRGGGTGGGYRNISVVMHDRQLRQVALLDALNALESIQLRFGDLAELAPVWRVSSMIKRDALRASNPKRGRLSGAERSVAQHGKAKPAKPGKAVQSRRS